MGCGHHMTGDSEMESLLSRAKTDAALYERLHGERVVFFLHLLGLDMNGHAHRPNSAQYRQNVASVDQQVAALERLLQDFYQDNKTAFVVSADHGMSNKGSHGDGEPECTQTPLIVWGAGVRRAGHRCKCKEAQGLCKQTRCSKPVSVAAGHDSPRGVGGDGGGDAGGVGREVGGGLGWFPSPADWGDLRYIERRDLQQAQLAPLIATLVGQPSPRNNIGLVPVAYLDMPRRRQVEVLLANLRQVLRQLDRKQHLKNQTTIAMLFYPYPPNGNGDLWRRAGEIEKALAVTSSTGGLEALQEDVVALFRVALAGLDYYHTYDLAFLRGLIVAAYLGGMASLAALAVTHTSAHLGARPPPSRSRDGEYRLTPAAMGVGVAVSVFVSVQQGPAQYYLYVWFAVVLWDRALAFGASTLVTAARILLLPSRLAGGVKALVVRGLAVILIECVVLGFFYRAAFSVASLALAPAVFLIRLPPSLRARLRCQWGLACLSTAVFTLLSVEFGDDLRLVVMGGLGLLGVAAMAARRAAACQDTRRGCAAVLWAQFAVGVLALAQVCGTVYVLENQWGLHVILSAANWGCLLLSLALPLRVARVADDAELRFLSLFVGWGTAYLMLAINYESLFLLAFFALLYAWLQIEVACQENGDATGAGVGRVNGGTAASASKGGAGEGGHGSEVEAALARYGVTAVLLLYLTNLGYFGTGNIASVSSFELKSVLRFMAVFDPFMMGAMLLFKIALPFVLVAAAFSYISHLRAIPRRSIECVMLFVADVMSLHFFFLVFPPLHPSPSFHVLACSRAEPVAPAPPPFSPSLPGPQPSTLNPQPSTLNPEPCCTARLSLALPCTVLLIKLALDAVGRCHARAWAR